MPFTAHDVRKMRACSGCDGIGDMREMLSITMPQSNAEGFYHGGCVVKLLSHDQILALPSEQTGKLRLSETGKELMEKLLDRGSDMVKGGAL